MDTKLAQAVSQTKREDEWKCFKFTGISFSSLATALTRLQENNIRSLINVVNTMDSYLLVKVEDLQNSLDIIQQITEVKHAELPQPQVTKPELESLSQLRSEDQESVKCTWRVTILGAGASSSSPTIRCHVNNLQTCTCNQTPYCSFNHRLNPSILLTRRLSAESDSVTASSYSDFNIIVDVCKTFRESAFKSFRKAGVKTIDSVILTHNHTDAIGGLDDLRDVQQRGTHIPVYADAQTGDMLKNRYAYLFPEAHPNLQAQNSKLYIGALRHTLVEDFVPFYIEDMEVVPVPLWHGSVTSLGFIFTPKGSDTQFVYFSDFRCRATVLPGDTNEVPDIQEEDYQNLSLFVDTPKSLALLKRKKISVMMLDAITWTMTHISHSNKPETVRVIQELKKHDIVPQQIYFTGMSCKVDYFTAMKDLLLEFGNSSVLPAYDGLDFTI